MLILGGVIVRLLPYSGVVFRLNDFVKNFDYVFAILSLVFIDPTVFFQFIISNKINYYCDLD